MFCQPRTQHTQPQDAFGSAPDQGNYGALDAFGQSAAVIPGATLQTAGPPLVYKLYRQPLSLPVIRQALLVMFGLSMIAALGTAQSCPGGRGQGGVHGMAEPCRAAAWGWRWARL